MGNAQSNASDKIKIVVTVHGIRTFGQWQERLGSLIVAKNPSIFVEHYHYGYFSVIAFLIPPLRWLVTLRFRRHVREISARFPGAEISFVAHSFGTHLVGYGLYGLKASDLVNVSTVLLAGSVLRTSFPWGELINAARVKRVINDCGINDNILLLSQFCVLFTGMAGRLGFGGMTGRSIVNRYFVGGHSHYFESKEGGESEFMERYWLPILVDETPPVAHDKRVVKGPIQGVVLTLIQIADPIKLLVYFGIAGTMVMYLYWLPKLETRESISRAMQSDLERTTAVSRTYYETLNDIPRAIASLSAKVLLSDKDEVGTQRHILKYWFQSVRPIEDVLHEVNDVKIIRWSKNYYIVRKGMINFLTHADVIAGVRITGTDKIFLICSDNIARIVSMSSLSVEKEIAIPPPRESMDDQWGSAQFNFSEFQSNVSDLIAAQLISKDEGVESVEDQSVLSEKESETQEDEEENIEALEVYIARLNDPISQSKNVEVLNLEHLKYDAPSGLVVGIGWVRSHVSLGEHRMQVFDPENGTIAFADLPSHADFTSDKCSEFRIYDFHSGTEWFDMNVRLRKPGESSLFHYYVTKHNKRKFNDKDACEEGLIDDGLISRLEFPSVVTERYLWKKVSDGTEIELPEDNEEEKNYDPSSGWVENSLVVGEWHYSGLIENGQQGRNVRRYSEWGFEAQRSLSVPWDQTVRWTSMSDGSKYGIYHICRFRISVAAACAYVRCMGDYCHEDFFQGGNLMAISSRKEFGNNSLYVLNLNTMNFIHLPETPDGGSESVLFDKRGVLSVLTSEREMWLYSNLNGVPISQSMLLVPPSSEYLNEYYDDLKIEDDPIAIYADGGLGRIGRFTMSPVWISTRLPGSGRVHVHVSKTGGFLVVNNDTFLVLLDSNTGISISRPLRVKDFSPKEERGWGAEGISISIAKDDSVAVSIDDDMFYRAAALSEEELDDRLQRIVQYIGFDHDANSVSALPVSK